MKTLKLRIKDKHGKALNQLAIDVNLVWNYVNDLCFKHLQRTGKFMSAFDVAKYTAGSSKAGLNLHSQTIQAATEELITRRKQFKKAKLRWRVANPKSAKKSLGWIPFKASAIKVEQGQIKYGKQWFGLWDSYNLSRYTIKTGSFVQDSRGRWYACLVVDTPKPIQATGKTSIGIDLGLKDLATCSNGVKIANPKYYKKYQQQLAIAQRANKKRQVKAIHARIKNSRQDHLHKVSSALVKHHAAIFVGNLSAKKLVKTKMAKSVLDTGFAALKTMLRYKCENAGVWFGEVNESYTTVTCSHCNGNTGPSGLGGLGIREWECMDCGTVHDRDINAATNILRLGRQTLAGGIPDLKVGEDVIK